MELDRSPTKQSASILITQVRILVLLQLKVITGEGSRNEKKGRIEIQQLETKQFQFFFVVGMLFILTKKEWRISV
jgi:hypothetical protein